ncbi:MAG TPA: tetratricopeptide repeat protein [Bacteroidia bacterium]|nr:tetratricopeptide repeat protein [Bacteroidia bacterium]HNP98977.1 tetratricopeptide repeat protein [Bacteroidia bacterium]
MDRIELLKRYLQEDPDDSFSWYALALEYIRLNDLPTAQKILSDLTKRDPDYLPTYYQLARVCEQSSQTELAIKVYEKGKEVARNAKNQHTFNELETALRLLKEEDEEEE